MGNISIAEAYKANGVPKAWYLNYMIGIGSLKANACIEGANGDEYEIVLKPAPHKTQSHKTSGGTSVSFMVKYALKKVIN